MRWLDSDGKQVFCKKPPTTHKKIRRKMSIRCSLIHPSTMYRLSIVKKAVDLHQGSIKIDSQENQGTNIIVRLPV